MKLLIGIPSHDYMHAEFVKCLTDLIIRASANRIPFDVFVNNGTLVHVARDKIACKAINEGYTHVLWLDADMVFTPDILETMLDDGKPIISGIAHSRRRPYVSCLFKRMDSLDHLERFEEYPSQVFRVAGCGFACILTDVDVLRSVQMRYQTCFLPTPQWGEDLSFCRRATEMGFEIWADPHVRLGHIGHDVIWPEDHDLYMQRLQIEKG